MNAQNDLWRRYEAGRVYNTQCTPDQYALVETNTEFFQGNQWLHLPDTPAMRDLPKPTFNILKRVASLFVASLTSASVAIRYDTGAYYTGSGTDPDRRAVDMANAAVKNLLEQFRFDYRVREALFDGACTGDYCAHFYFDPDAAPYGGTLGPQRGEICMELVDGINVMFGNPNDRRVQTQPYILIVGRDSVENLKREQQKWGGSGEIFADSDGRPAGRPELPADDGQGKALYLYCYEKRSVQRPMADGTTRTETEVVVTKATRDAVIYENVATGLLEYPIAWGNWERRKHDYHGGALVTHLIPNQIFINSMFATAMRHLQLMAFPKTVYNADLISTWTNEVGQAIGVHGLQNGQSVSQIAYNLPAAEMSGQIFALIDKAMAYTKECLGATDAQLGTAKAENTSALIVLQTNAQVPLENIRAGLYEWVEDVGRILLDMMGAYYGVRSIVREREFEEPILSRSGGAVLDGAGLMTTEKKRRRVVEQFDFSCFRGLWVKVACDVGEGSCFSEIAMTETLDNLRREGVLDLVQYLERLPDKVLPRRQELIDELKAKGETT